VENRLKTPDGAVVRLQGVNIVSLEWNGPGMTGARTSFAYRWQIRVACRDIARACAFSF
jgi:hypothetical protein